MIGALCTLMARGAIVSVIIVLITVIPSLLMVFDRLIYVKQQEKWKKLNNRKEIKIMKNKLSRITASIILGTTLMYTLPVSAFTKDETVYSNLNSKGQNIRQ